MIRSKKEKISIHMNMNLPELPKQIKKREAAFGLQFRRWVKREQIKSSPIELKQTITDSISFTCIKRKQIAYLKKAKSSEGILIRNNGGDGQPDYTFYANSPAWIVIRYPSMFFIIDIDAFLIEKQNSDRKSLTDDRAFSIATWRVLY